MYTFQGLKRIHQQINKLNNIRNYSGVSRGVQVFVKKNLLLTNSITSGAFMALGDFVEQEIEIRRGLATCYDWTRIGHMFTVGTVLGPLHHYYYIGIDKLIPKVSVKTVFIKILCEQTFAGPLSIVCFYYGMGLLERKSHEVCTAEIKKKFLTTFAGDCIFWPPIQFINYYYLPTHYRVIYINVATMIFNVFLSYMKHYDKK